MKYVKLTARPNTWFKEGTEVFDYDFDYSEKKRITLEVFEKDWKPYNMILCRGIRIVENPKSEGECFQIGEEYEDGEFCNLDEFDVEIIDE